MCFHEFAVFNFPFEALIEERETHAEPLQVVTLNLPITTGTLENFDTRPQVTSLSAGLVGMTQCLKILPHYFSEDVSIWRYGTCPSVKSGRKSSLSM